MKLQETVEIPEGKLELTGLEENGGVDPNAGTVVQKDNYTPADVAAAFFRLNAPKFRELLAKMAPYQIRNALMNAVTYPFTDTKYEPESQDEKTFAYLVHEMLLNKTIMQLHWEMEKAESDLKKQEENVTITNNEEKESV